MNGISQTQGDKKLVLLRLSLAGNMEKPIMSLYGTRCRECGYELRGGTTLQGDLKHKEVKAEFFRKRFMAGILEISGIAIPAHQAT